MGENKGNKQRKTERHTQSTTRRKHIHRKQQTQREEERHITQRENIDKEKDNGQTDDRVLENDRKAHRPIHEKPRSGQTEVLRERHNR